MVEPVSVTVGVLAAALLAKAGEKAAEQVGERAGAAGAGAVARFAGWLRSRVAGHPQTSTALAKVEEVPDSPARVKKLGEVLDQYAGEDEEFAAELAEQVGMAQAELAGLSASTITLIGAAKDKGRVYQAGRDMKVNER